MRSLKRSDHASTPYEIPKRLRSKSHESQFSWTTCCFFCGRDVGYVRNIKEISKVTTYRKNFILEIAKNRSDSWDLDVIGRLENCYDLLAVKALYHVSCDTKFRLNSKDATNSGRPVDSKKQDAFTKVGHWLECEGESQLYTVAEVYTKMREISEDIYCFKSFREKLKERYKEHVKFVAGIKNLK